MVLLNVIHLWKEIILTDYSWLNPKKKKKKNHYKSCTLMARYNILAIIYSLQLSILNYYIKQSFIRLFLEAVWKDIVSHSIYATISFFIIIIF